MAESIKTASARGKANRRKGKMGEKEFLSILQAAIDECTTIPVHKRPQARRTPKDDGADIIGIEGLAFEIKRRERLQVKQWWRQALNQAESIKEDTGRPCKAVLAYRQNNDKWKIIIEMQYEGSDEWIPMEMKLEAFLTWFKSYVTTLYS